MKKRNKTYILLSILFALSVITILINRIEDEKITANEEEILSIDVDDITEISWSDGKSLSFYKDEKWYYSEDENFPVDEEKMETILSAFEQVISTYEITNVTDYAQYGLNDPDVLIYLEADESYEIALGGFSDIDSQRYAMINNGSVYLLKEDIYDSLNVTLNDLMKIEEVPTMSKIVSFELSGDNELDIVYDANRDDYLNQYVYYLKEDDEYLTLDTTSVQTFIYVVSGIEWQEVVTYNLTDLSEYGLDSPSLNVEINYEDDNGEENVFEIDFGVKNNKYYARIKDSKYVYEIEEEVYNNLMEETYNDLRPTNIVDIDWENVDNIELVMDDYYSIDVTYKDDIKYKYNSEYVELDEAMNQLDILTIQEFTNQSARKSRELKIIIHQNVENYEEIEISFYKEDGENSLVVVNGETLGFVKRSDVVNMIEEINQVLLDVE